MRQKRIICRSRLNVCRLRWYVCRLRWNVCRLLVINLTRRAGNIENRISLGLKMRRNRRNRRRSPWRRRMM